MTVSLMREEHLPQVATLSQQLGYPINLSDLHDRWKNLYLKKRHSLLVYLDQEKVLGWIHSECVEDLIEEDQVEIKALIVEENSRGNGVGKKLIEAAEIWAKTNHLHTIYLSCNILREKTHLFYERAGYSSFKTSHFFRKKI